MPRGLVERLEEWKGRFGTGRTAELEGLLRRIARTRLRPAAELIRLHEALLFLRAYPRSARVARLADAILFGFADRVRETKASSADADAFEEPEVSGIAGTSLGAVFSYEVARRLAELHPRSIEIGWDAYDGIDKLGLALARVLPLLGEDWPVEAHVPYRQWIAAARGGTKSDLKWLLERLGGLPEGEQERAAIYDALELPLAWDIGDGRTSRSRLRLPKRRLYCHQAPLLRRSEISLERELEAPPLPVRRLSRAEAAKILDVILDTSAMRYRELYGFSHPDAAAVYRADAGRGVEIYFCGVPPQWRLPLRAYHGGMFFKNGVPAGYVELLSLFERAEVGFNLYYTFREGESAWLYGRLLRLFRQVLGVSCFSVDPYQVGWENAEAIDSGAFWFYRKLGFRPVEPSVQELVEREEGRMRLRPGYRSSKRTLERLAGGYLLYEGPGAERDVWDRFRVRNIGLAVQRETVRRFGGDPKAMRRWAKRRAAEALGVDFSSGLAVVVSLIPGLETWPQAERASAREVLQAKERGAESRYLRLMQRHRRLRAELVRMGSDPGTSRT